MPNITTANKKIQRLSKLKYVEMVITKTKKKIFTARSGKEYFKELLT